MESAVPVCTGYQRAVMGNGRPMARTRAFSFNTLGQDEIESSLALLCSSGRAQAAMAKVYREASYSLLVKSGQHTRCCTLKLGEAVFIFSSYMVVMFCGVEP